MAGRGEANEETNDRARLAAGLAVLGGVILVALLLFARGDGYTVTATFQNASQLVSGNDVRMGGVTVGSVKDIGLAEDGQAEVKISVDSDHSPLQGGTRAVIRQISLSGIANRYVDLQLPEGAQGGEIPDGGELPSDETQAAVELDSVFNTLDERTRRSLQRFFKGSAAMFTGREEEAREGYRYLGPSLSASRRLLEEAAGDTVLLERFIVDSARLVAAVADRDDDLAGLVQNLGTTTRAAAADKAALTETLDRLPGFMRRANTTFVNLRGALDDVDPLVDASKPAVRELRRFVPQLRGFAADAEPTVRDLSRTIRVRGSANDLVDLARSFPPLADIAVDSAERNGRERRGALPESAEAFRRSIRLVSAFRPYTPDLFGWFDDFSHTGGYDALGGFSRTLVQFNLFSADVNAPPTRLSPQDQAAEFLRVARTGQVKRCPGHAEVAASDGSNVYTPEEIAEFDCDPSHRASGESP